MRNLEYSAVAQLGTQNYMGKIKSSNAKIIGAQNNMGKLRINCCSQTSH